jgi:hypothetical protein
MAPDPVLDSESGSGSGSTQVIESGSHPDPDPQPWFKLCTLNFRAYAGEPKSQLYSIFTELSIPFLSVIPTMPVTHTEGVKIKSVAGKAFVWFFCVVFNSHVFNLHMFNAFNLVCDPLLLC